jgi:archaeosine-15-forming tRNA-guanine transglycosylase
MRSLEDMDEENEVRNFLAYAFGNTLRQFQLLNPEQRVTVRSILAEFTQRGTGSFVRDLFSKTIVFIDSLDSHPSMPQN